MSLKMEYNLEIIGWEIWRVEEHTNLQFIVIKRLVIYFNNLKKIEY